MPKKSPKKLKSPIRRKSRKRESRRIRGGAFLNQGEFGMVFDYAPQKVIKVFFEVPKNRMSPSNMGKINEELLDIDPERKYFNTFYDQKLFTANELQAIDPEILVQLKKYYQDMYEEDLPPILFLGQIFDKVVDPPLIENWNGDQMRHMMKSIFMLHYYNLCHEDLHFTIKEYEDGTKKYQGNVMFKHNLPIIIDLDSVKSCASKANKYADFERLFFGSLITEEEKQKKYPPLSSSISFPLPYASPSKSFSYASPSKSNTFSYASPPKSNTFSYASPSKKKGKYDDEDDI